MAFAHLFRLGALALAVANVANDDASKGGRCADLDGSSCDQSADDGLFLLQVKAHAKRTARVSVAFDAGVDLSQRSARVFLSDTEETERAGEAKTIEASVADAEAAERANARLQDAHERSAAKDDRNAPKRVSGAIPVPPLSEPGRETSIVVEVSAFLDGDRCGRTLGRALAKASAPERVVFSVLQARGGDDVDCASVFKEEYLPDLCRPGGAVAVRIGVSGSECSTMVLNKTRAWTIAPDAGQGPVHQRGVAGRLLQYERDDDMCLSMDSHMDFQTGWDDALIADWASTRNEFAVLTAYPADVSHVNDSNWMVDVCGYSLENDIPRGRTGGDKGSSGSAPYLTMNWAAGMSFHRCHMERTVPVDWHLRWIFTGEEVNRAVRLFTHGYDTYLPTNHVVLHEYAHAAQAFQTYGNEQERNLWRAWSERHLQRMFESLPSGAAPTHHHAEARFDDIGVFGNYGLGHQRSLEDYVRWSRVNLGGKWKHFLQEDPGPDDTPTDSIFCSGLGRAPVSSELDLIGSVNVQSEEDAPRSNDFGEVELTGDEPHVRPRRVVF